MTTNDNPPPPLTAEKILENHGLFCDDESLDALVIADIEALITQQTAADKARIQELEEQVALYLGTTPYSDEGQRYQNIYREAIKRGGELKRATEKIAALQAKLDAIDVREYSRLIGENERLKQELDEANAQVAMLTDKIEAAVKPYREALETIASEQTSDEYNPLCDEPSSSLIAYKALKATEELE